MIEAWVAKLIKRQVAKLIEGWVAKLQIVG
jgi:hypothetical protein